ncbi:MAG: putative lipid II flippase FtsW [Deltaproteobacteria bacterium]|nr:putative lipid II flippase FtsW [Deltaproteobacteria bacterium]NIS78518.1 putative lipid II flippase FtsW [Deltaproteobacteria bacterium]
MSKKTENIAFLLLLFFLCTFGAVMLYSSSYILAGSNQELGFDKAFYIKRQVGGLLMGLVLFLVIQKIDYFRMKKLVPLAALLSLVALSLVFAPKIGVSVKGAHRWLKAGPVTLQPSEFSRFALIGYFAFYADKKGAEFGGSIYHFLPAAVVWGLMLLLIVLEPDYGMSAIICALFLCLVFVGGFPIRPLVGLFAAGVVAFGVLLVSSPYRMNRLFAYLDPQAYAKTTGYQVIQSLVGFANGGLIGTGIGAGKQKLFYLPEIHTDYIFAVIGEELGFLGVFIVATIFLVLFLFCLRISRRASDQFGRYFAFGTGVSLALCAFMNMGVSLKLFPPKGMVLPFMSYGRSSVIAHMIAMGVVYKISCFSREKPEDESADYWGRDRRSRIPRIIHSGSD